MRFAFKGLIELNEFLKKENADAGLLLGFLMWLLDLDPTEWVQIEKNRCVFRLFRSPCPSYDSLFRYHNDERSNGFGDWQPLLQVLDHEVRPNGNFLGPVAFGPDDQFDRHCLDGNCGFSEWIVTSTERLPSIRCSS